MSQINSNIKDDFQVVLLLSCFVGHPVNKYEREKSVIKMQFLSFEFDNKKDCFPN